MDYDPKAPPFIRAALNTSIFSTENCQYVYHYTDLDGLMGICRSKRMWATDVLFMNDASEYVYAQSIIEDVISAYSLKHPEFAEYKYLFERDPLNTTLNVFAACFCERSDLLSQWRAYAKDGTGYAVEFSWQSLRGLFPVNRLGHVEYEEREQKQILRQMLEYLTTDGALVQEHGGQLYSKIAAELINALFFVRAFLKSPAFREEREWRIISFPESDGHKESFRASKNVVLPYCEMPLGEFSYELPITKIIIGPSLNPEAARKSLRRFLNSVEMGNIEIESSPIPLKL
jgi:hypothetical protein